MQNEEIGLRIKRRRKELGVSVAELSTITGLSKATIHRYENNSIKHIKLPVIDRIAKYLDINPSWLIGKSSDRGCYSADAPQDIGMSIDHLIRFVEHGNPTLNGTSLDDLTKRALLATFQIAKGFLNEHDKKQE